MKPDYDHLLHLKEGDSVISVDATKYSQVITIKRQDGTIEKYALLNDKDKGYTADKL
jgi:hypothetical protein